MTTRHGNEMKREGAEEVQRSFGSVAPELRNHFRWVVAWRTADRDGRCTGGADERTVREEEACCRGVEGGSGRVET